MPAEPAPGQAVRDVVQRAAAAGRSLGYVLSPWEALSDDERACWDASAAAVAAPLDAEITRLRQQLAETRSQRADLRRLLHAAMDEQDAAGDDLEDYRQALTAMQRERDTLREQLAARSAELKLARITWQETQAELQEVHAVLVTAYAGRELSEDTPAVVAALAADRDRLRNALTLAMAAAREMSDEFATWTVTPEDKARITAWRRQAGLEARDAG